VSRRSVGGDELRTWVVRDPHSGEPFRGAPSDALLTVCGCLRGATPEGGGGVSSAVVVEIDGALVWMHASEPEAVAALDANEGLAIDVQVVPGTFRWVLQFDVAETWVTNGLDLTPERMHAIVSKALGWIREGELRVSTVAAPVRRDIRVAQGHAVEETPK